MKLDSARKRWRVPSTVMLTDLEKPLSTGRVCQLLSILGNWQPAPAPIFHVDLLDDDEGGLEWLIEDIEKQLACSLDQDRLLLGSDGGDPRRGALARNLNSDDRHGSDPFLMAGALATVHMEDLARDEAGAFEVEHRIDDIAHFAHPCDRMQFGKELVRFRPMHRRLDHPG